MRAVKYVAFLLMVIGALNWGLIGFFRYDLVGDLFGGMHATAARVVFSLVGLAGLYGVMMLVRCCCCKCGPGCNCSSHNKKK